jgi:hypothetical protein
MGQRLYALVALLTAMAFPAWAGDQGKSAVQILAMEYFESHDDSSIDEFLTQTRPAPLGRADCDAVIASLPKDGELQPRPDELAKIEATRLVLQYHRRLDVVTFKVIDVKHAFVGLHARSVLLASRDALALVSPEEFAALVAHEIAHDYMWDEYREAMQKKDNTKMQELELRCDGIAVLTLRRLGMDPERLVSAVLKVTRLNQLREAVDSSASYVPTKERIKFIRTIAGLQWH